MNIERDGENAYRLFYSGIETQQLPIEIRGEPGMRVESFGAEKTPTGLVLRIMITDEALLQQVAGAEGAT